MKYERPLSEKEHERLRSDLPWFGQRRKEGLREIDKGVIEIYEFGIDRIWNINGCGPHCCPHTLLFRTTDGQFVYIETWQKIEQQKTVAAEKKLRFESTPVARKILKFEVAGEDRVSHTEELREFNELFEIANDAEWQIYQKDELPEHVIAILESVHVSTTVND